MIQLDQQQEDALRLLVLDTGQPAYGSLHRRLRFIARLCLTLHRFFRPRSFEAWNEARIREWRQGC